MSDLTLGERMISASAGALLTSLLVTPLDVVKTRLQTQFHPHNDCVEKTFKKDLTHKRPLSEPTLPCCSNIQKCPRSTYFILCNGLMEHAVPKSILFSHYSHINQSLTHQLFVKESNGYNIKPEKRMNHVFFNGEHNFSHLRCVRKYYHNKVFDVRTSMLTPTISSLPNSPCFENIKLNGMLDGLYKILKYEGVSGLYIGLRPTLVMAIPATVLYFAAYDYLSMNFKNRTDFGTGAVALFSGTLGRVFASTAISPLELIRTKMQAANFDRKIIKRSKSFASVMKTILIEQTNKGGFFSLWKGLFPTLLRDVPFSAIYWVVVETIRKDLRNVVFEAEKEKRNNEVYIAFISGACGGIVAAVTTTPFDVIKTRRQVFDFFPETTVHNKAVFNSSKYSISTIQIIYQKLFINENSTFKIANNLIRNQGIKALFTGLLPRVAKVTPSCAIMLSSYEAGKQIFKHNIVPE